jgi:ribosomal protein S27AE
MKRCTSCGEWFFFYVLKKDDKSSVIKSKAFCSRDCERKFLEPHVKRFYEEHLDRANLLLENNRSAVEQWFSSQMGCPEYDVWSEQFEKLFKRPRLEEALETILSGKDQIVGFETLGEAMDLTTALFRYCPSRRACFERIRIKRTRDWFPFDSRSDSYFVFVDENWRNNDIGAR